jgi:HAD superfamily hydrolase (TIGR01549 family)
MQKYPNKVFFFDLYQTLLDVELSANNPNHEIEGWEVFAKTLLKYGKKISGSEFQKLYMKRRDDFYSNKSKEIYHHNLFEIISNVLKKDLSINLLDEEITELIYIYRKASRGHLRLYPGVFDILSNLSKDYTLSTASHTQGSFTQLELRELDIEQFFSYFVYSSDVGLRKESTEFYKRALEIVGKEATDCVIVGDNYDVDVLVPLKLGINGIWVENPITSGRYAEYIKKYQPQNTIKLENLQELPTLIEQIMPK